MFIMLYCCLLVRVQSLSLAWADFHHTDSFWALFQRPIIEFQLGYPIFYLGSSKFSSQYILSSLGLAFAVLIYSNYIMRNITLHGLGANTIIIKITQRKAE